MSVPRCAMIGAGPPGLSAARALQKAGLDDGRDEASTGVGGLWDIENLRSTCESAGRSGVSTFFGSLGGMAIVAGWWAIRDIVTGLGVAALCAAHTRRRTSCATGDASRHAGGDRAEETAA